MNELLKTLAEKLEKASFGSKAVAGLVAVAAVFAISMAAVAARRPHYELAFSGLSDHEVARVNKALAEAGIAFETSQPPTPFSVYVDRSMRSEAYSAVYGAGALDKPLKGILSESGMSSVFQGAEERLQTVRKREWQEMEGMLEALDFVVSARVRTSAPGTSMGGTMRPGFSRDPQGPGASVTLRLAGTGMLTQQQSQTVAQLVSRGLGIPTERLVIADQDGNQLYDGTPDEGLERKVADLLAHRDEHDRAAMAAANRVLEGILGPNKVQITVRSDWDFDQSTVRTQSPSGKGSLVSERKNSTETPIVTNTSAGGITGIDANVATNNGGTPNAGGSKEAEPLISKTSEEDKQYQPTIMTEERVRFMPSLTRLSVAVFLDESLDEGLAPQLEQAIKAAVGFVDERDAFRSVRVPFASAEEAEEAADEEAPAEEAPSEPNPMLEMLLERGVEVVVSLVFILLLLKSLKGGGKQAETEAAQVAAGAEEEIDPELLARAKVEELLKADPEQVGSILSSWANQETVGAGKG